MVDSPQPASIHFVTARSTTPVVTIVIGKCPSDFTTRDRQTARYGSGVLGSTPRIALSQCAFPYSARIDVAVSRPVRSTLWPPPRWRTIQTSSHGASRPDRSKAPVPGIGRPSLELRRSRPTRRPAAPGRSGRHSSGCCRGVDTPALRVGNQVRTVVSGRPIGDRDQRRPYRLEWRFENHHPNDEMPFSARAWVSPHRRSGYLGRARGVAGNRSSTAGLAESGVGRRSGAAGTRCPGLREGARVIGVFQGRTALSSRGPITAAKSRTQAVRVQTSWVRRSMTTSGISRWDFAW